MTGRPGDGAAPAATAQPAVAEVFVDTPDNGEAVKARRVPGDRLSGKVTVSGTTGAGAVVIVRASCEEETDCRTPITAAEDGAFEHDVEVWSPAGRAQGRLIIGLRGSPSVDGDRLVLLLEAEPPRPGAAPEPRHGKQQRRRERQPAAGLDPVPVGGVSYAAANARLDQLARELGRLRVVPWAETVAGSSGLLGRDRVHATAAGYRTRAQLYARAAGSC